MSKSRRQRRCGYLSVHCKWYLPDITAATRSVFLFVLFSFQQAKQPRYDISFTKEPLRISTTVFNCNFHLTWRSQGCRWAVVDTQTTELPLFATRTVRHVIKAPPTPSPMLLVFRHKLGFNKYPSHGFYNETTIWPLLCILSCDLNRTPAFKHQQHWLFNKEDNYSHEATLLHNRFFLLF